MKAVESGAKEEKAVVPEGKVAELKEVRKSQLPDLPIWSPSDYEKVKKGEIVAGQQFFAPAPGDPEAKIEREGV